MGADQVTLTVPSMGEYAKTVRMTAAALVDRMGMTYDDVDDVRMAAEEVFVYACDHAPSSGEITMEFSLTDDSVEIKVGLLDAPTLADEDAEQRAAYATFILQSVTDLFEMSSDGDGTYLRVVKNASVEQGDGDV